MLKKILFFITALLVIIFTGCEPVSVSINSKGDIAFTRETGVFFYNIENNQIKTLYWNYPNSSMPVIVRWSQDEEKLAFTMKENKSSQETKVYIIDKNGNNMQEIATVSNVVLQLEWSPDGNYLSYALPGADTDMSVADIGLISLKNNENKIIIRNSSDVHKWYNNNIVFMSVKEKNADNSSILKGDLSIYDVNKKESKFIVGAIINSSGYLDCSKKGDIVFTAYDCGEKIEFKDDYYYAYSFLLNISKPSVIRKITSKNTFFNVFSSSGNSILLVTEESSIYSLNIYNMDNQSINMICKDITFKISTGGADVSLYPAWYDNNNILFFKNISIYGSNGTSLSLMSIGKNGTNLINLQPTIEYWMDSEIKKKGGYIIP